jgi:hypothetical protein
MVHNVATQSSVIAVGVDVSRKNSTKGTRVLGAVSQTGQHG